MSDLFWFTGLPPRSVAGIAAFGEPALLRAALEAEFSVSLPGGAGFVQSGGITISCLSPTRFLATAASPAALPARLANSLGSQAAITDQSDLWAYFTASGPDAREHLARLVGIDLDTRQFPVGGFAATRGGHLDVRLWHVGESVYELAVGRSYAAELRHAF